MSESQDRASDLLAKYRQIHAIHMGDEAIVMTSAALLKETLRLLCELADLPVHPHYQPKAGGPKAMKKPIVRDIVPVIDGVPLHGA